jgi:glycosyltransferase involved in cell wall biosynthesis
MTKRRVLIEADNLTHATGTGIATYARNLGHVLHQMNYVTDGLISVRRPLPMKDAMFNRIVFYDPRQDRPLPWSLKARLKLSEWFGEPFGVNTQPLMRTDAIIDPNPKQYSGFDNIHTVFRLVERARYHFMRHKEPMAINAPNAVDVFHATQAIPVKVKGVPNIYTIHDIIPLRLPYTTLDNKKYTLKMLRGICKSADHIVTVSEHSKRDIVEFLDIPEDRVTNTYQAVSLPAALVNQSDEEVARDLDNLFHLTPKKYFLFVGAIEPKKNVGRLVDAFIGSGSKRQLIIAGNPAWMADEDIRKIDDERFMHYFMQDRVITQRRRVRRLSYVPFDQLIALIKGARALVFPSLYEGFGLPVLEAMLLGTPVITSNVSSLPEIAGDAALMVDPRDTGALARTIRQLDADDDLCAELSRRGRLQAAKFSFAAYEDRLQSIYRKVVGS